jgi:O-methyltransferase involved in polyketide biosynthesis
MLPSSWITPTAHYTGHVWWRNGLSHPAFRTAAGHAFYAALEPLNRVSHLLGGPTLEAMLITRHGAIDDRLTAAIEAGEVSQVLEVAAGLSPRGLRFVGRHPELVYVEADLPAMAARKESVLDAAGSLSERHRVVSVDALAEDGAASVGDICRRSFDPDRGVAIVTEGLISYFDTDAVAGIWRRFAAALASFSAGLYLSDLHTDDDIERIRGGRVFRRALNRLTRGSHHIYFADAAATAAALSTAGFSSSSIRYASDLAANGSPAPERTGRVRIIEAGLRSMDPRR